MNGFLNLLKPPGMTSSDAVVAIRRTLSGEKVGHAGTLDPEAAGVLPIMIGKASRLFDALVEKEKTYIAEIAFGTETDTQDAQGKPIAQSAVIPSEEALRQALPQFIGHISQIPPAYSALKVAGRAAYALARKGESPMLAPRPAHILRIALLEMRPPDGALLEIVCGKGVYIRTLCHDIGKALGTVAHMRFLLRTHSGAFTADQSVTLEEWLEAGEARPELLMPLDRPLSHLPAAYVDGKWEAACRNGTPMRDFVSLDAAAHDGGPVRIYCAQAFAGIGRWHEDALRFQAMLLE